MKIFNMAPAEALWSLVRSLADRIPVYKEVMDEDENSVPESYLLLRTDVGAGDSGSVYGDGTAQLRQTECDIVLVSKSKGANTNDIHNQNKASVLEILRFLYDNQNRAFGKESGIPYRMFLKRKRGECAVVGTWHI